MQRTCPVRAEKTRSGHRDLRQRPRLGVALTRQQAVYEKVALRFCGQRINLALRQRRHGMVFFVRPAEGVMHIR